MFKKTEKILKSPKNRTSESEPSSATTTVTETETTEPESSTEPLPTCTKEGCSNEVYVGRSGKIYSLCLVHIQVSYSNTSDHQTNSTSTTIDDDDRSTIKDPSDVAGWTQSILRRPSLASKRNAEAEEPIEKQKSFQQPTSPTSPTSQISPKLPTITQEAPISETIPNCLMCDEPCYVSGNGKIYAYCGGVVCNNSEYREVPNNYWEPYYVHQPLGADLAEQVDKFEESQIALDPTFTEQVNEPEDLSAPPDYVPSGEFYSNIFYDQKISEPLPPGYESEEDSGSDDEHSNEVGQSSSTRKEEHNSK